MIETIRGFTGVMKRFVVRPPLDLEAGESVIIEQFLYLSGPLTEAYAGIGTLTSLRLVWRKARWAGVPSRVRDRVEVCRNSVSAIQSREVGYRLGWQQKLDFSLKDGGVVTFEVPSRALRRWKVLLEEWMR